MISKFSFNQWTSTQIESIVLKAAQINIYKDRHLLLLLLPCSFFVLLSFTYLHLLMINKFCFNQWTSTEIESIVLKAAQIKIWTHISDLFSKYYRDVMFYFYLLSKLWRKDRAVVGYVLTRGSSKNRRQWSDDWVVYVDSIAKLDNKVMEHFIYVQTQFQCSYNHIITSHFAVRRSLKKQEH